MHPVESIVFESNLRVFITEGGCHWVGCEE